MDRIQRPALTPADRGEMRQNARVIVGLDRGRTTQRVHEDPLGRLVGPAVEDPPKTRGVLQ